MGDDATKPLDRWTKAELIEYVGDLEDRSRSLRERAERAEDDLNAVTKQRDQMRGILMGIRAAASV